MSKRKGKVRRHEVRVTYQSGETFKFTASDRSGILAQGFCASRRDIAREATKVSALAAGCSEGHIKITSLVEGV